MLVDGHCHSCGFDFDGHWSQTGTCLCHEVTCPKCLIKGKCSLQSDEVNDYGNYSDSGDDYVDTIDE